MARAMPKVASPQPFVVRRSSIQGRGGYATRDIRKGERIVEYVGERISWAEADRRYDDTKLKRHHTFLFTVNNKVVIDAAVDGNDARFINHSCDPNCEAIDEKGRIYIEALRDLAKGEELFYDYGYARDKDTTEEDEQLYVCHCGSPKCRGTILEPKKDKPKRRHHAAARQPHEPYGTPTRERALRGGRKAPSKTQAGKKGKTGKTGKRGKAATKGTTRKPGKARRKTGGALAS